MYQCDHHLRTVINMYILYVYIDYWYIMIYDQIFDFIKYTFFYLFVLIILLMLFVKNVLKEHISANQKNIIFNIYKEKNDLMIVI